MGKLNMYDDVVSPLTKKIGVDVPKSMYNDVLLPSAMLIGLGTSFIASTIRIFLDGGGLLAMILDWRLWPTFLLIGSNVPLMIKFSIEGIAESKKASYNNNYKKRVQTKSERYTALWIVTFGFIFLSSAVFLALEITIHPIAYFFVNILMHTLVFCGYDVRMGEKDELKKLREQERKFESKKRKDAYKQHRGLSSNTIDKETKKFMDDYRSKSINK